MKILHPPCPSDNGLRRTVNSAKKLLLSSRSEMLNVSIISLLSDHVSNIHLPNNTMILMTDQNDLPTQWTADYWELQHEEHLKKRKLTTKFWKVWKILCSWNIYKIETYGELQVGLLWQPGCFQTHCLPRRCNGQNGVCTKEEVLESEWRLY